MSKKKYCVYNTSRETFLSLGVHAADTAALRLRGLLGKLRLTTEDGLWVVPSRGVHTLGLLFPLDLIYLDTDCRVIHMQESFQPFGVAPLIAQAASVLQLATHSIYSSHTQLGDKMLICVAEEMEQRLKHGIVAEPPLESVIAEKIAIGPLSLLVRPFAGRSGVDRKASQSEPDLSLVAALEMAIGDAGGSSATEVETSVKTTARKPTTQHHRSSLRNRSSTSHDSVGDRPGSSGDGSTWRPGLMTAVTALKESSVAASAQPAPAPKPEITPVSADSKVMQGETGVTDGKPAHTENKTLRQMPTRLVSGARGAAIDTSPRLSHARRKEDVERVEPRHDGHSSAALAMPLRKHEHPNQSVGTHMVRDDSKDVSQFFRIDEVLLKISNVHDGKSGGVCVLKTSHSESVTDRPVETGAVLQQDGPPAPFQLSDHGAKVPIDATSEADRKQVQPPSVSSSNLPAESSIRVKADPSVPVSHNLVEKVTVPDVTNSHLISTREPERPPSNAMIEDEKRLAFELLAKESNFSSSVPNSFENSKQPLNVVAPEAELSTASLSGCTGEIEADVQEVILAPNTVPEAEGRGRVNKWYQRLFHKDRRRKDRRPVDNLIAYFWSGGQTAPQSVRDISETGFYLETDERWYPGTVIRMTLQQDSTGDEAERDAIAVESMAVRQDENGVGLRFVLPDADKGDLPVNANFDGAGSKELKAFLARFLGK